MNCEILETLYVRSNGDIPCDCDKGEHVLLGTIDSPDPAWDIHQILTNGRYAHIRASLSAGVVPWDECRGCALLRTHERFSDNLRRKRIRKIQLEPSLACNLECPCCSNKTQRRTRAKPFLMELETFDVLLRSLRDHSYVIGEIEYSGQGDPLMHPRFKDFVRTARSRYPQTIQRVVTNGNFEYPKALGDEFLDQIVVSCDGVFQESYEQYRIGGDVERVRAFMKAIPRTAGPRRPYVVWKYILFEWNDSDDELIAAQQLAQSVGIDTLMFVYTHSRFRSVKHVPEAVETLPIVLPNVTTSVTPHLAPPGRPGASSFAGRLGRPFRSATRRLRAMMG